MPGIDDGAWILTYSGIRFNLVNPKSENVQPVDLAHHLARICRFTGAVYKHYSVAQHCCLVSDALRPTSFGETPLTALIGLLHDGAEAYVGDMNSPLKSLIPEYKEKEDAVQNAVWERFNITTGTSEFLFRMGRVKEIDKRMCQTEYSYLMPNRHPDWTLGVPQLSGVKIVPWDAQRAEGEYLHRLNTLCREVLN